MSPLSIEIMDFFNQNQDKHFKCWQLAQVFGVSAKEVFAELQKLPIESFMQGRARIFLYGI